MLTDIEFAQDGSMIIGFRDRFGDQSGPHKFYRTSDNDYSWGLAQGDILKACESGGNYTLETGTGGACPVVGNGLPNSGPGGTEFYQWDIFALEQNTWDPSSNNGAFHWETTQGGLLQLDSLDYVFTTAMDPFDDFSGGILKLNNNTGGREGVSGPTSTNNLAGGYTIFESGDFSGSLPTSTGGYSAKANGLGDLEGACQVTLMIGNYVWYDANMNGLQDSDEPGLANVTVSLYENGTLVGQAVTDQDGYYVFGGPNNNNMLSGFELNEATTYELRIAVSSAAANDGSISNIQSVTIADANGNNNDNLDSDALAIGSNAVITFTTGNGGETDYTLDFGFSDCEISFQRVEYEGCEGDGYQVQVNGTMYNESNPYDSLILVKSDGCDSIIVVDLFYAPQVVVNAGMLSAPICSNQSVQLFDLGASISGGISTGMWTSMGGGTFDNNGDFGGPNPATQYIPSSAEISAGVIILTLTSDDPPSSCEPEADAVMIEINDISCSQFPWAGGN